MIFADQGFILNTVNLPSLRAASQKNGEYFFFLSVDTNYPLVRHFNDVMQLFNMSHYPNADFRDRVNLYSKYFPVKSWKVHFHQLKMQNWNRKGFIWEFLWICLKRYSNIRVSDPMELTAGYASKHLVYLKTFTISVDDSLDICLGNNFILQ